MITSLVILFPLIVAGVAALDSSGKAGRSLLGWAPLPALLYSLIGDKDDSVVLSWVLLESRLGLGYSGPIFLFLAAGLWCFAGWYGTFYFKGDPAARRVSLFWLLTLTGNLGLVVAGDVPTFYAFFALMTFSAYGMISHSASHEAWRAGKVYIVMAVAAEGMLVAGFLFAVAEANSYELASIAGAVADSERSNLIIALVVAGFGVKAGVFPLHFWLPLAHPVAPTPASAVLSGVMIKAGLLGWIHFLPGGAGEFPAWSMALIAVGVFTAFYGVVCGMAQRAPKTILAYSSISQMGLLLIAAGAGLANLDAWSATVTILAVYALNHGLCKGALFLGTGVCDRYAGVSAGKRRWLLGALALPGLGIAGAPFMGGAIAKYALKGATENAPPEAATMLLVLLPLSAVATTLLIGHFLCVVFEKLEKAPEKPELRDRKRLLGIWLALVVVSIGALYFTLPWFALEIRTAETSITGILESLWPILAGAFLLLIINFPRRRWRLAFEIPPGDLLGFFERRIARVRLVLTGVGGAEHSGVNFVPLLESFVSSRPVQVILGKLEAVIQRQEVAGILILVVLLSLWVFLR